MATPRARAKVGDCLVREVDDELLQLDGQVRRPVAFDLSSAGGREHPTPQALAYRERTPEPVAAIRTCVDSAANRVRVVGGMTADDATGGARRNSSREVHRAPRRGGLRNRRCDLRARHANSGWMRM